MRSDGSTPAARAIGHRKIVNREIDGRVDGEKADSVICVDGNRMPCGIQDCVCRNVFCGGNGDYSVAGKVHESTATHRRIQIRFRAISDGASRLILPDSDQGEAQNGEIENGALNQTPLVHTDVNYYKSAHFRRLATNS